MIFDKLKEALSSNNEKYEVLHHKHSQLKLENKKLKDEHYKSLKTHKISVHKNVAENLIKLYNDIEMMKADSYKVNAKDKDIQRLMIGINKTEKTMREIMKEFSLEEIGASERFFDPELHEVASYQDAKGMAKGIIMKTVKKGFKYRGEIIKKPQVVVTK